MSIQKSSENEKKLQRLLDLFSERGVNQAKFIEITGYSSGQASAIWNKKANLNRRLLRIICKTFSFSEEYIETGRGEKIAEPDLRYGVKEVHRAIDPEMEKLLALLDQFPGAREIFETAIKLPPRKQKIYLGKMLEDVEEIEKEKKEG